MGSPRRLLAINAVSTPGGAELAVVRLMRELGPRGWAPTFAAPGEGGLSELVVREGWSFASLDPGGLQSGTVRAVRSWPRARRLARGFDVVYLNGGVPARLLPAIRAPKVVLHLHDIVDRVPAHWRRADVVLAASQAVADRLEGLDPHVVYAPVDLDPPHVEPPWQPNGRPVVGFVGRLERRKNPLALAQAAPALREAGVRVVVVGDDAYDEDSGYAEAVKRDTEHHGWVDDGPSLMRHLDVLVLPSEQEPFGTVLAEAMAVGTPVVATRVGGLAEVVEDGVTGRLVERGDPESLKAAILDVLARRTEMGAAARESAKRFDAKAFADRVETLIGAATRGGDGAETRGS